jgi:hypothetical protein
MSSVVIFCKTLVKGGAEKQALSLASLLAERGEDVVVVSWSRRKVDTQNKKFITENSLKHYGLHGSRLMRFVQFNRILKKENAAVVFSYLTLANIVAGFSKVFNKDLVTFGGIRSENFLFVNFCLRDLCTITLITLQFSIIILLRVNSNDVALIPGRAM